MLSRDLRWFLAVVERRHVTEAAALLGVPQPTVSRAVARLERELGASLLRRQSSGVVPTPIGDVVVDAARELVAREDRMRQDVATALDPERGVVRLAFLDSIATSIVPEVLGAFHVEAPAVRVRLSQEPAHHIRRDLEAGRVDLAITSDRPEGAFGWTPLAQERLVVVVSPRHRWAERRALRVEELAEEELITTPEGFGFRALVDGLLRREGVEPRVAFESQDLATIEGLAAAGLGVAVLPEPFAGASGTVGIALRDPQARRTVGLTWRTDETLVPPVERFRTFVVDRVERGDGWGR